jgi:hypothetical protein
MVPLVPTAKISLPELPQTSAKFSDVPLDIGVQAAMHVLSCTRSSGITVRTIKINFGSNFVFILPSF